METITVFFTTEISQSNHKYFDWLFQKGRKYSYGTFLYVDGYVSTSSQINPFNLSQTETVILNVRDTDTLEDIAVLSFNTLIQRVKHYANYYDCLKIVTDILSPKILEDLINQAGIGTLFSSIDMSYVSSNHNAKAHSMINNTVYLNQTDYINLQRKLNLLYQTISEYRKLVKEKNVFIDNLTFKSELDDENIKDLMKMLNGKGWLNGEGR